MGGVTQISQEYLYILKTWGKERYSTRIVTWVPASHIGHHVLRGADRSVWPKLLYEFYIFFFTALVESVPGLKINREREKKYPPCATP